MTLTRSGLGLLIAGALFLAGAVYGGYPELLLAAVTIGAGIVLATAVLMRPIRLEAHRTLESHRISAGDSPATVLLLTNLSRHSLSSLHVQDPFVGRRIGASPLPPLTSGVSETFRQVLSPLTRGVYPVARLRVHRTDAFGLVHRYREYGDPDVLYVHPSHRPLSTVQVGGGILADAPGSRTTVGDDDFHGLRPYVPGDDIRLLHWLATARTGEPYVRHELHPVRTRFAVVLDNDHRQYAGALFEQAVQAAASVCVAAGEAGYAVSVRAVAAPPSVGTTTVQALDVLAGVGMVAQVTDEDREQLLADLELVTLAVVTGSADTWHQLLPTDVRRRYGSVVIVVLRPTRRPTYIVDRGVTTYTAASCEDFAHSWNDGSRL